MIRLFYPLVRIRVVLTYANFGTDSNFSPSHCQTDQQMEAKTSMWCAHQPKWSVFKLSTDFNLVKKTVNGLILCKTFFKSVLKALNTASWKCKKTIQFKIGGLSYLLIKAVNSYTHAHTTSIKQFMVQYLAQGYFLL